MSKQCMHTCDFVREYVGERLYVQGTNKWPKKHLTWFFFSIMENSFSKRPALAVSFFPYRVFCSMKEETYIIRVQRVICACSKNINTFQQALASTSKKPTCSKSRESYPSVFGTSGTHDLKIICQLDKLTKCQLDELTKSSWQVLSKLQPRDVWEQSIYTLQPRDVWEQSQDKLTWTCWLMISAHVARLKMPGVWHLCCVNKWNSRLEKGSSTWHLVKRWHQHTFSTLQLLYRVAKTHRIPYLCRSFSAKVTYI